MSLKDFHESNDGKRWLYWISLAAVGLTVVGALRKIAK